MRQRGFALSALVLGVLGAALSVVLLLVGQTGDIVSGTGEVAAEQLPILVVGAGAGFLMGVLAAVVWSIIQRLFAPSAPRA